MKIEQTGPSSLAGTVTSIGTIDSVTASANGAVDSSGALIMQSASATVPGLVNTTTQSFAGNKTFTGTVGASNLSGTNTGDQTISLTGDVTGSGTGSFATTVAKVAGTTVSGTTGTTNVVFSSAPTLSNPVVGTQSTTDNSTKAASTAYVTTAIANAVAGVNPAVAVQAATVSTDLGYTFLSVGAGIGSTLTGTVNTALTIDGYTFTAVGQRLLVKNQTTGAQNGVYYVTQVQTGILAVILTRALDFDTASDINNTGAIPVVNGTVNTTTQWVVTSTVNTVDTDTITFTKFTRNPADYLLVSNNLSDVGTKATAFNNVSPVTSTGDIIVGNGTNSNTRLAVGTQYQSLQASATTVVYGAVNLAQAAAVTGVLPNANTTAASANTASAIVARDGSGNFTAGTVTAALSGNATTATTATNATNTAITDDTSTNATMYPTWVTANTGNLPQKTTSTKLTYNPSTGALGTTTFVGAVTGTASGNTTYSANNHGVVVSGSSTTMTVIAPDSSTTKVLTSGGSSADPSWQAVAPSAYSVSAVKTTTYSILTTDSLVLVDGTSAFTATLPTAVGVTGKVYIIKRVDQTLANAVTIATTSSQTIDGVTTRKLMTQYEQFTVVSDGTNWQTIDHSYPSSYIAYTPTGAWSTNTTYTGAWKRVGDSAIFQMKLALAGAPTNAALTVNLPTGLTIDTTKLYSPATTARGVLGQVGFDQAGTAVYYGFVTYSSTSAFYITASTASSTYTFGTGLSSTIPFTYANGDSVNINTMPLPITNWEA